MNETRDILDAVAAGHLTPEAAAERLRERAGRDEATAPSVTAEITTLRVVCGLAEVRLVADPTVAGAVAHGPHEARTDGTTMTIGDSGDGKGFAFRAGRGFAGIGRRAGRLEIRANPDLDLEVELAAGELVVAGMHRAITATVTAGSLRLDDFRGPIDLTVKAGTVEGTGRLTDGDSTVSCKLGEVRLDLHPDSDVTISARARVGEIRLPDGPASGGIDLGDHHYVFGRGTASLRVDTTAGSVQIRAQR
jgi:hypothetical protein